MYLTERELLERQRSQFFRLQKFLREKNIDLDDICELLPGIFHMNRINSVEMVYLDKASRERIEVKKEQVGKEGLQIVQSLLEPSCLKHLVTVNKSADFSDPSFILSTFQHLTLAPIDRIEKNKPSYSWCFSSKKKFNEELTISITQGLNELGQVYHQVEQLLENTFFLEQNFRKFDNLTRREREIMRLIAKGTTSEQIARQLFISPHTVNTHRKNIWKKLEVKSYLELIQFAEHFDML